MSAQDQEPSKSDAELHMDPHTPRPDRMTEPCSRFFAEHGELWGLVHFMAGLTMRTDEFSRKVAEYMVQVVDEKDKAQYRKTIEEGSAVTKAFAAHLQTLFQMMLSRGVDNFLSYVSELLALIFRTKPETLRSSETVTVEFVLEHSEMVDLIQALTERRVDRLSYQSMRDLVTYLSEKLGFDLFPDEEQTERVVRIVETRNLIVHNRAIVNRRFIAKVPRLQAKLGKRLRLLFPAVNNDLEFLARSVCAIDERAVEKFGLQQTTSRRQQAAP